MPYRVSVEHSSGAQVLFVPFLQFSFPLWISNNATFSPILTLPGCPYNILDIEDIAFEDPFKIRQIESLCTSWKCLNIHLALEIKS
jgi:hypothetical protein